MIHRPHPVGSDPQDAILYDDCERCSEHADILLSLDTDTLGRLWDRTVAVEADDDETWHTATEYRAGLQLWKLMLIEERLFDLPIVSVCERRNG